MQYISPFSYCLQHPVFIVSIIFVGIFSCYSSIKEIQMIQNYGVQSFSSLRIDTDGSEEMVSASLTILFRGCAISSHTISEYSTLNISMTHMDGFLVNKTSGISRGMQVILEGSNDDWETRQIVGSLRVRWTSKGILFQRGHVQTEGVVRVDYFPPWPWFTSVVLGRILWTAFCLVAGLCGIMQRPDAGKSFCILILSALSLATAASASGFAALQIWREVPKPSADSVVCAAMSASLMLLEAALVDAWTALAVAWLLSAVLSDCIAHDDCPNLLRDPPVLPALLAILGAAFILSRRRFVWQAIRAIEPIRADVDRAWETLAASEPGHIARLDALYRDVAALCAPRLARQLNHRSVSLPGNEETTVMRTLDETRPVASLDQLYAQALGAAPVVRTHCRCWAARSGGALDDGGGCCAQEPQGCVAGRGEARDSSCEACDCRRRPEHARSKVTPLTCDDHRPVPGTGRWWAARPCIKHPDRAIAKATTRYSGDASRLLDLCRARIVFERAADLVRCFEAVRGSPGVTIVRVRNGLSPALDSCPIAGYRVRASPHHSRSI
jgi:hypothetical protein